MSPSHANKQGVRYRYYVSQALLQNRKAEAGSVSRVSGPDIEAIVVEALRKAIVDWDVDAKIRMAVNALTRASVSQRQQRSTSATAIAASPDSDRELIARHVARVVLRPRAIEITLNDHRDDS